MYEQKKSAIRNSEYEKFARWRRKYVYYNLYALTTIHVRFTSLPLPDTMKSRDGHVVFHNFGARRSVLRPHPPWTWIPCAKNGDKNS
jgi:hypothetical protein